MGRTLAAVVLFSALALALSSAPAASAPIQTTPQSGRTILVATTPGDGFAQFGSRTGTVRADGREVFWWGELPNSNFVFGIIAFDPATGSQTYVSLDSSGVPLDSDTSYGISPDGRFVTFVGRVENPPGIVTHPVLLRDRTNGTTTPISLTPDGAAAINVANPRVSGDGRYVVFEAGDDRLDPSGGPVFGRPNTFLRDVFAGITTRVSTVGPEPGVTIQGRNPKISADGRWITFENGAIFLYDRINHATDIVARTPSGSYAFASDAAISDDGRFIAYSSRFVMGVPNGQSDIFVYDRVAGTTTRASVASDGTVANRDSFIPAISGDGRFVAFQSTATNLDTSVPDTNGRSDIFVRDLVFGTTRVASVTSSGTTPNRENFEESISLDGTKVTFTSRGTDVLPGDTNNAQDVFMRDLSSNTPPVVHAGDDGSTTPGVAIERQGSFVDNDADQTWSATVNYGDGPAVSLALRPDKTYTLVHTYTSLGVFVVEVAVSDDAGGTGRAFFHVTVGNFRPVVSVGGMTSLNEGDGFVGSGSFIDTDTGQNWSATVDYGDGTITPLELRADKAFTLSHQYEAGTFTLTVTVSDGVGQPGTQSLIVTVANAAPQVTVQQQILAYVETNFRLEGTFTDPGQRETYQGTVDFGDGSAPEPLDISGHAFSVTHRFTAVSGYDGTLILRDSNGAGPPVRLVIAVLRRPLIFIPGIGGSRLFAAAKQDGVPIPNGHGEISSYNLKANDELWPAFRLWIPLTPQDDFDRLKFDEHGNSYVSSVEARSMLDDAPVDRSGTYFRVASFFAEQGYTSANFRAFPYDWRESVDDQIIVGRLDDVVSEVMAATHADSVDIVAHSLGTLITRSYLQTGAQRSHVAHAVLLGSPQLGTPDALGAAAYGKCLPTPRICLLNQDEMQDVLHTLPSAVESVPSQRYWDTLTSRDPRPYVDLRARHFESSLKGTHDLLQERGVSSPTLATSQSFHASDASWTTPIGAHVTFVSGVNLCTPGQLADYTGEAADGVTPIDMHRLVMVTGDGTVTRHATGVPATANELLLSGVDHGRGLIQDTGLGAALSVVQDRPRATDAATGVSCKTAAVHSPAELVITDSSGRRTGSDGQAVFGDIPQADVSRLETDKFVTLNLPGSYRVDVYGTGFGSTSLDVTTTTSSSVTKLVIFAAAPTTPSSRGTFTMDATDGVSDLFWDTDGDGTIDLRVAPRVLTGAAARDQTVPVLTIESTLGGRLVAGGTRISWSAADAESGIASTAVVIDPGTPTAQRLDAPGLVALSAGTHVIRFVAENGAGLAISEDRVVTAMAFSWLDPLSPDAAVSQAGRTIPVKFNLRTASGSVFADPIASVEIQDANGTPVVRPIGPGSNPANGVATTNGDTYHANVSTAGLAPGNYQIVVRFSSSSVTGEVRRALVLR